MKPSSAERLSIVAEVMAHSNPHRAAGDIARRRGLDKGLVWVWVLEAARASAEQRLPLNGLMARLLDDAERVRLLADLRTDATLVLINRFEELLPRCVASSTEIRALFAALPSDRSVDSDLSALLSHPNTPESLLFELLDQGRCISQLGHRAGPQRLLERLAAEHRYAEAITTLALNYYGGDDYPLDAFVAFVVAHSDCHMLVHNLERSSQLSAARREAALDALK